MNLFNFLNLCIFLSFLPELCLGKCKIPNDVENYHSNPVGSVSKRTVYTAQLKIVPHYTKEIQARADFAEMKEKIIEPALRLWERILKIRSLSAERIYLQRSCKLYDKFAKMLPNGTRYRYCRSGCEAVSKCYSGVIPEQYLDRCNEWVNDQPKYSGSRGYGIGYNEFLFVIDSQNVSLCHSGSTLAYATHCRMDSFTDRPVAGYANMCPGHIKSEAENIRQSRSTMEHELAHALGFLRDGFRYMRDANNNPRTSRDPHTDEPNEIDANLYSIPGPNVLGTVTRQWRSYRNITSREVTVLKTPIMVQKAREYFSCPELDGVELESEESEGNRQHIERRILENELMTALYTQRSHVSTILLGYFEDTGWYTPDYKKAGKITYGKHLGCDFIMRSCYDYMQRQKAKGLSFYPYCDYQDFYKTLCLKKEAAYGYCDLTRFTDDLDVEFQYFEDPKLGGRGRHRDRCPIYLPYNGFLGMQSYCNAPERDTEVPPSKNFLLHGYGKDAICIDHDKSRKWEIHQDDRTKVEGSPQSTCLKHICSETEGLILIIQNEKELVCPVKGKYIDLTYNGPGFQVTGSIICPPCNDICKKCPKA